MSIESVIVGSGDKEDKPFKPQSKLGNFSSGQDGLNRSPFPDSGPEGFQKKQVLLRSVPPVGFDGWPAVLHTSYPALPVVSAGSGNEGDGGMRREESLLSRFPLCGVHSAELPVAAALASKVHGGACGFLLGAEGCGSFPQELS